MSDKHDKVLQDIKNHIIKSCEPLIGQFYNQENVENIKDQIGRYVHSMSKSSTITSDINKTNWPDEVVIRYLQINKIDELEEFRIDWDFDTQHRRMNIKFIPTFKAKNTSPFIRFDFTIPKEVYNEN